MPRRGDSHFGKSSAQRVHVRDCLDGRVSGSSVGTRTFGLEGREVSGGFMFLGLLGDLLDDLGDFLSDFGDFYVVHHLPLLFG